MKKKASITAEQAKEHQGLLIAIDRTRSHIDSIHNHFEEEIDPTLIDCYIYELKAAQLRYQFLLRRFKSLEQELHN